MRYIILFLVLLFKLPNSIWGQSYWEQKVIADSLFNKQEYVQSAEFYKKIITNTGGTPELFYNASMSWASAGNIDNALIALDSAFLYGYDELNTVEREERFNILRNHSKYKELISRERQFYSVGVINNKWLLSALNERKGLTLDDTKWEWEWEWEEIGGWEPIETYPELDLKFTTDSLYDFSEKTLTIYNSNSKDIELSNLKLKSLNINNRGQKTRDVEIIDIYSIESLDKYSTLNLNNLDVEKLELSISNINFVNLQYSKFDEVDIKKVINTDIVLYNRVDIKKGNLGNYGTLNDPIKVLYFENVNFGIRNEKYTFPLLIYSELFIVHRSNFFNQIDFISSNIKQLNFLRNFFEKKVAIGETNFFNEQNYLPYHQFTEGFILSTYNDSATNSTYIELRESEVKSRGYYDRIIQIYKKLHSVYRQQGDTESANSVYTDLKDIMIERLRYKADRLSESNQSIQEKLLLETYSHLQIKKLLRWYTKSGTNPALAIFISFWIVLGFSIVYIFFPSEWDNERNKRLVENFRLLIAKDTKNNFVYLMPVISNSLIIWLNALALSLNAFVTLGFGSIPIKGFGKYFCILQGFIGWFLLSLFTVTLINQILI